MRNSGLTVALAFIILTSLMQSTPVSTGLDTGPIGDERWNKFGLPLDINIKLWGFNTTALTFGSQLKQDLPSIFYHESVSGSNSTPTQHKALIEGRLFVHRSLITYSSEQIIINGQDGIVSLSSDISLVSNNRTRTVILTNGTEIQHFGTEIIQTEFVKSLQEFDDPNGYTIHLLNLEYLTKIIPGGLHWFSMGGTDILSTDQADMRNLGIVSNTSLFFDPTALAPLFESQYLNLTTFNLEDLITYVIPRITSIIEQVIIGSPYSFNYIAMRQDMHVAQVIVGTSSNDFYYRLVVNELINTLEQSINSLFPYLKMRYSYPKVSLSTHLDVASLLERNDITAGTTPTIIVDSIFSEDFKSVIRANKGIYSDYPIGWFYPIVIFADDSGREYQYENDEGIFDYKAQEIGFGIVNLKDWRLLEQSDRDRLSLERLQLKLFGNMIGIHELTGFTSQIDSPMSEYGVSPLWNGQYTNFEIDSMTRKYTALFNHTAWININSFRASLEDSEFKWLDTSELDKAEVLLIKGRGMYSQHKFLEAAEFFVAGFNQWEKARDDINQKIISIKNSLNFIGGMIILVYIINFLKSSALSKEKFLERYNERQTKEITTESK